MRVAPTQARRQGGRTAHRGRPARAAEGVRRAGHARSSRRGLLVADVDLWPGPPSSAAARAALAASCRSGRSQVAASTDTLRHTAAHRWLAAGGSEGGLMAVAGWTHPDMLLRYTKARASERAAEEARALNLGTCERARPGYRRVPALPFGRCASSRGCGVMPPWRVCPRPPRVLAPPGGRSWTGSRAMIGRRRGSR